VKIKSPRALKLQTQKNHGSDASVAEMSGISGLLPAAAQRRRTHAQFGKVFLVGRHRVYTSRLGVGEFIRVFAIEVNLTPSPFP
jgi:hypothetical protein